MQYIHSVYVKRCWVFNIFCAKQNHTDLRDILKPYFQEIIINSEHSSAPVS